MLIKKLFSSKTPLLSFEFFPPKTNAQSTELFETLLKLLPLSPSFVSVTCSTLSSLQDLTTDLVLKVHKETNLSIVPHLICMGKKKEELLSVLTTYTENNIQNIFALRGDLSSDLNNRGDFQYASSLVKFIKKTFPHFCVGVAAYPEGHPESKASSQELDYLKEKLDAGADYLCTQLFFDNTAFYQFREKLQKAHIDAPVIAGIMPIETLSSLKRITSLAQNVSIPKKLLGCLEKAKNVEAQKEVGLEFALAQVQDLIKNEVLGIHFYTLNKSQATFKICQKLKT